MKIQFDKQKLQKITDTLFILTGISIAVLDREYNYVCKSTKQNDFCTCMQSNRISKARCKASDQKLISKCKESKCFESHICHAGLYDAVAPIIKNEIIVGYVIMGRVRSKNSPQSARDSVGVRAKSMYSEVPLFDDAQIDSIKTLISELIFESAITVDFDETIEKIGAFLSDNITKNYTIDQICAMFCVSKNYLYSGFLKIFGTTVNEYVITQRIERAKQLLLETSDTVCAVGQAVGIDNYTYFCKLFKKRTGLTPSEFKKSPDQK